eukprot:3354680-Prorocentrum_lima.AAC.1
MDSRIEVELERMKDLQAQAQLQLKRTKDSEIAVQLALTSELREKDQLLDSIKEKCEGHGYIAKD